MKSVVTIWFLSAIIAAAAETEHPGDRGVISEALEQRLGVLTLQEKTSVLVSMESTPDIVPERPYPKIHRHRLIGDLKARAARDQKALRSFLARQGVSEVRSLWVNNMLAVRAGPEIIRRLAQFPEVVNIRPDVVLRLEGENLPASIPPTPQWHLDAVGATTLWGLGLDGTGIVVANMDTGVDVHHPDLAGRWRGGTNSWKDVHGPSTLPYDLQGHGTATMGIMVGGSYGGSAIGVAPGAQWIAVKIFDDNGDTSYSKIHEGFQWLLDPDGNSETDDAPDIVNNSWGMSLNVNKCIAEFQQDLDILRAAGIAVVFSAGNAGPLPSTSVSPANNRGRVAVGAVDDAGGIALFSSRGPSPCGSDIFPSVAAPGVNIKTADLTGGGAIPDSYAYMSGTSYAAAMVSGGMALLMGLMQDRNITQLEQAIFLSSTDAGQMGPDDQFGHGIVNLTLAHEYLTNVCPEDLDGDFGVGISDVIILMEEGFRSECPDCRTDVNGDQRVDLQDFSLLAKRYGRTPCPSRCAGDIDGDFSVSMSDLSVLAGEWLAAPCPECLSDINKDGTVNSDDFNRLAAQFGKCVCQ